MSFTGSISSLALPQQSVSALARAGFESFDDFKAISPAELSRDTGLSLPACTSILQTVTQSHVASLSQSTQPKYMARSAASMLTASEKCYPVSPTIDKLLGGGLKSGHILDLSGPPGSPKERMILSCVQSAVKMGEEVVFIDFQNMTLPSALVSDPELLSIPRALEMIRYMKCHTLTEFTVFLLKLSAYLDEHPKITLLVLNSLSFVLQYGLSTFSTRQAFCERMRGILSKACASKDLTVVITSQISTRFLDADGSPASFDSGRPAVIVPQLGSAHLPESRAYRIMLIPDSPTSGVARLLGDPSFPNGQIPAPEVSYQSPGYTSGNE